MPPQRPWVLILSGVFAAGFACGVVATLARTSVYRFEHVRLGEAECFYRANRITGAVVLIGPKLIAENCVPLATP